MPLYLGSTKIKEVYLGSTKIKEIYLGAVKKFSSALEFIKNSVCSISSLTEAYTLRQQSYNVLTNYNGFTFKSSSGNNGSKVVYYPLRINNYTNVYVKGTHYNSGSWSGMRACCSIVVGTRSQIAAIRYGDSASDSGCTIVVEDKAGSVGGTNNIETSVDVSRATVGATEDIYIGIRLNSYYGATNRITLETLTLS